ncbi:helix-turn-helix domain-containing protein [Actinomadura bangladeshensis]|uniref:XRE family transcriptional regulator n=1 Tax=Actinomadura bangladeshensis TaxID=453573 RepID=A0A4R4NE67_9ACTN|nr:hypothetical protein [Actinomadura bangladeshensis]TDC05823.1 hypothetical protein E1284_34810 [Actinomadura bangladeshensis]
MSLYDRIAAKPGGESDLAKARLRYEVLGALQRAFTLSQTSQADLARKLRVRRSAVNGVVRGDGNVRINTLAEYLFEMGFELNIELVEAGEPYRAESSGTGPAVADDAWQTPQVSVQGPNYVVVTSISDPLVYRNAETSAPAATRMGS